MRGGLLLAEQVGGRSQFRAESVLAALLDEVGQVEVALLHLLKERNTVRGTWSELLGKALTLII